MAPRAQHLADRVVEIDAGQYDEDLAKMKAMPEAELRQIYNTREIEAE
jgi:hypothetical protein